LEGIETQQSLAELLGLLSAAIYFLAHWAEWGINIFYSLVIRSNIPIAALYQFNINSLSPANSSLVRAIFLAYLIYQYLDLEILVIELSERNKFDRFLAVLEL